MARARKTRKALRKKRATRKRRAYRQRQRGGALQIESVSKEHEADTIVTVRPDSREEDSIPMTGRLTVMRELLED